MVDTGRTPRGVGAARVRHAEPTRNREDKIMSGFHIPSDLTGDALAVAQEVRRVDDDGTGEISDACARVIASWWHGGQATAGYAFVSTGAITTDDPSDLWHELCGSEYANQRGWERAALDCLGTYLTNRESRDAVPGWSALWVR